MSRIRGKNTGPEVSLRKALWAAGIRGYRIHKKSVRNADIAFMRKRIAIFVDGCFWHGCPEHGTSPKNNAGFWEKKIKGTMERDQRTTAALEQEGWTVLRFWEHSIRSGLGAVVEQIQTVLQPIK